MDSHYGDKACLGFTDFRELLARKDIDQLFFFYSLDLLPRTDPFLVSSTMPSALERNGDFSQTRNNAGRPA